MQILAENSRKNCTNITAEDELLSGRCNPFFRAKDGGFQAENTIVFNDINVFVAIQRRYGHVHFYSSELNRYLRPFTCGFRCDLFVYEFAKDRV